MRYRAWLGLGMLSALVACGGPGSYAEREEFQGDARYRRDFPVEAAMLCAAAGRVLLGEGYVLEAAGEESLVGGKEFQIDQGCWGLLQVHVVCEPRSAGASLFVAATEAHFDVKTSRQSTSVGLPIVAPISIARKSEVDLQLKTYGETVTDRDFYERFYRGVQRELGR